MKYELNWYMNEDGTPIKSQVVGGRKRPLSVAHPVNAPADNRSRAPLLLIRECPFCHKEHYEPISRRGLREALFWGASECLELSADVREMFITGICPPCWDKTAREE